jgi:arabinose-5-phosphate isomerase
MTEKGFTREAFGLRHPGGKLGLQLQSVADWLEGHKTPIKTVSEKADMKSVIMAISEGGVGSVAVLNSNEVFSGLITDGDLRRAMDGDFFKKAAGDIMTRDPYAPTIDMKIKTVIDIFTERRIGTAYIVQEGRPIGVIDMKSLLAEGYMSS